MCIPQIKFSTRLLSHTASCEHLSIHGNHNCQALKKRQRVIFACCTRYLLKPSGPGNVYEFLVLLSAECILQAGTHFLRFPYQPSRFARRTFWERKRCSVSASEPRDDGARDIRQSHKRTFQVAQSSRSFCVPVCVCVRPRTVVVGVFLYVPFPKSAGVLGQLPCARFAISRGFLVDPRTLPMPFPRLLHRGAGC